MTRADSLERARAAYARRAWGDAYDQLSAADRGTSFGAEDLERLATAAYLTGRHDAAIEAWERAHHAYIEAGAVARAARVAFWLAMTLFQRGHHAQGGGWIARAQRLLDDASLDCAERGYLLVPPARGELEGGDPAVAYEMFSTVSKIAERFGDPDLVALGRLGRGHALLAMGETARGVAMLDDAVIAVATGEVSPIAAGIIYCSVIIACRDIFDVRRAQEWTAALSRWCAEQQDIKPYRGQCLVHRSEIMQLHGEWSDAMQEVRRACEHLSDSSGDPVLGMALYQQAELLRLRGDFGQAEEAYREAGSWGQPVHPGLALLRLAEGRIGDAMAAIRRVLVETERPVERSRLLSAYIEIMLAGGEVDAARVAADELDEAAIDFDSPYLRAVAAYGRGCVLLADGDAASACAALRRAWVAWHEIEAPYEAARVRVRMAEAYGELKDHDTAEMELDAARRVFEQLGAVPALTKVSELSGGAAFAATSALTAREIDVLRLVATGATNRQIANALVISEKTVARHLSNIFTKLGLGSRAAATAYAYEHDLV